MYYVYMLNYILQILIAIDQLVNTFLAGDADETLSSRAYRAWRAKKPFGLVFKPLIDGLFYPIQRRHCEQAYEAEIAKRRAEREL